MSDYLNLKSEFLKNRYLRESTKALTLMEMLIGIIILLIIVSGVYRIFRGVTTVVQKEEMRMATYRSARVVLDRMTREIRSCFITPWPLVHFYGYDYESEEEAEKEKIKDIEKSKIEEDERNKEVKIEGDVLLFVSFVPSKEGSDVYEIGYWLKKEENGRYTLMRHFEKPAVGKVSPDYVFTTKDFDTELVENIIDLEFRYYHKGEWLNSWDSKIQRGLPQAVEITFKFPKEKELKSVVYLPMGETYR